MILAPDINIQTYLLTYLLTYLTRDHLRLLTSQLGRHCTSFVGPIYTLSVDDVTSSVRQLHDKNSAADPIPPFVLKQIIDLIVPFVAELSKCSRATGHFPTHAQPCSSISAF